MSAMLGTHGHELISITCRNLILSLSFFPSDSVEEQAVFVQKLLAPIETFSYGTSVSIADGLIAVGAPTVSKN